MKQSVVFFATFSDLFSSSSLALFKQRNPYTFAAAFRCCKMAERRLPCPEAYPSQGYQYHMTKCTLFCDLTSVLEFFLHLDRTGDLPSIL